MKLLVLVILAVTLQACSSSPTGRSQLKLLGGAQMEKMGATSFAQLKKKMTIEKSASINTKVQCVVNRLLLAKGEDPGKWEVVVFREDSANAFALPGKYIGIHTGIMKIASTQGQLAAVIGHEIAHVDAGHGNERVSQTLLLQTGLAVADLGMKAKGVKNSSLYMAGLSIGGQVLLLLPYGRKHETESDVLGQQYMAKAGFNPEEAVKLWQKMGAASKSSKSDFLSTHPSASNRVDELRENLSNTMSTYNSVADKPKCY